MQGPRSCTRRGVVWQIPTQGPAVTGLGSGQAQMGRGERRSRALLGAKAGDLGKTSKLRVLLGIGYAFLGGSP